MSPRDADARAAFIRANTVLAAPSSCPEIRLHLATEVTPLWSATEDFLAEHALPPPYWAFAWAGGQALARHLLDHRDLVRGRRVLDFAAGSGIGAIAAARAGATLVEAADIDAMAGAAVALNAAANDVTVTVRADDVLAAAPGKWEVVLAGDVCYERPMAERVFAWLRSCAGAGALVLLADPGRAYLPKQGLSRLAEYTVACSRELEDRDSREVAVYRVAAATDEE